MHHSIRLDFFFPYIVAIKWYDFYSVIKSYERTGFKIATDRRGGNTVGNNYGCCAYRMNDVISRDWNINLPRLPFKKIYSHLNSIDKKIRICFRLYGMVIFVVNDSQLNGFHHDLVHHLVSILVSSNLFFVVCDMNQNESSERRFRIEIH